MNILKSLITKIGESIEWLGEIIVPENKKIRKILEIDEIDLKTMLPEAKIFKKDIFALFDYQNKIIKILVKSIKYKNNGLVKKRIAKYLHEELVSLCSDIYLFDGKLPILLPIPMSKKEKRERGFNQCEEVLKEIEKMNCNNFEVEYKTLAKVRETLRQTKLNKAERLKNIKNSMKVLDKSKIENRTIVIFDDIFTTLSTFNEAKRVLLLSGAKRVVGLFIAH